MPVLPSGRRVEFSLDRFHGLLHRVGDEEAKAVVGALCDPDDLLYVMDAVHFSLEGGVPFFADYVAAQWQPYAAEWSGEDRQAFLDWMHSAAARAFRLEAIRYIRGQWLDHDAHASHYPYLMAGETARSGLYAETSLQ